MISVFTIILIVLSSCTSETYGQQGIVPYEFCAMYYWTNHSYKTNYTIDDSDFIKAEAVMDFIRNCTEFQKHCNNTMLMITTKRFIKRSPQEYYVLYNVTIQVDKRHLFNKSFLNDNLKHAVGKCTNRGVLATIHFDNKRFQNLTLTLNVSGRLLPIGKIFSQGPGDTKCNVENRRCPTRSKEINSTCVCQPGTYLNNNTMECRPCSKNTYQPESAKISCLPCPPTTTTSLKTGSISSSNCSECQLGSYLDSKTTTCLPCPLHFYQDKKGQKNCIHCPDGKITINISSSSSDVCMENCTQGSYYNYTSENCDQCPHGKYQPFTGQDKCRQCPSGKTTLDNGSVYLSSCIANCSSGSYYDTETKQCNKCPKNTYQHLSGAVQCTPCPDGKVTSSMETKSRTNCVKENGDPPTLPIALSIAAVVALVVLIIAIKLFIDRRRIQSLMKKFEKNFEVYDNPYLIEDDNDEERDVEHCATILGDLKEQVLEKELDIPRDCIKFTGVTLGRGNFGEVHQVLVKRPDEPEILCAAKMSRGSHVTVQDMLEELDTHLKLEKNPNIVNLLGVCSSNDGPFYLLIEYCDNGCLGSFLKDHKRIPEYVNTSEIQELSLAWKLDRSLEICNGMKYLAHQRIVHRDLAARNILLDHNMVAKVSDFGMAKDVYVKSYYKQSHEGSFPLRWMAIESIEELSFTEKTDVWSFGVLLWEILTDGKLPYYYIINDEKVAQYILTGKKLKRPSNCPKSLYSIALKCWSDKNYNRPKFRDLYENLDLYIKNEQQENPVATETTVSSFKKRFNETKRSVSRRLSRRRTSKNSQTSTTKRTSRSGRKESQDIDNIDISFELDEVLKSSKCCNINDAPSPKETNDNPVIVSDGDQEGGISTDDKNEKNIDAMNSKCRINDAPSPKETNADNPVIVSDGDQEGGLHDKKNIDALNISEQC